MQESNFQPITNFDDLSITEIKDLVTILAEAAGVDSVTFMNDVLSKDKTISVAYPKNILSGLKICKFRKISIGNVVEFFENNGLVSFSDSFGQHLLQVATLKNSTLEPIYYCDQIRSAKDSEIFIELPKGYKFITDNRKALCQLKRLIEQTSGEEGRLTHSNKNILYLSIQRIVSKISATWDTNKNVWFCDITQNPEEQNPSGSRIFFEIPD